MVKCSDEPIAVRFARDVANHQMEIRHDDGLYRHVVFKRPDDSCMMFSLTTTPGRLMYAGDMGCFVFERLPDMFEFFRGDREPNLGYWHEKLVAVDRPDGSKERSVDVFRENLLARIPQTGEPEDDEDNIDVQQLLDLVEEACEAWESEGPDCAYALLRDSGFDDEFSEITDTKYTLRYEWACHAIQFGIAMYREAKK
jgi:hypothetical protein